MIQAERVKLLNRHSPRNSDYVIYWMQAAQRTEYNHALEYAILRANRLSRPLIVYFGLTSDFPEANARHYYFMLEGLKEVQTALTARNILMVIRNESPVQGIINLAERACEVVVDRGYLKVQREWRETAAGKISCPLTQVETDVIVPLEEASAKEEYSAATMRPKIIRQLARYLVTVEEQEPTINSTNLVLDSLNMLDIKGIFASLKIDRTVWPIAGWHGGTAEAKKNLAGFLQDNLEIYPEKHNDPNSQASSNLSPYLHFGQISPLYVALKTLDSHSRFSEVFLEELVIRRELAINYVYYNPNYDKFEGLPNWCQKTLLEHLADPREYWYSLAELENASTHDRYWNAAQKEMVITGKMHGYMRMYWGKKIIEWTPNPREAFKIALYLNNKYEIDGRDPNGFSGISWCFGKHDRPWAERAIFGNIRYMNDRGLQRKFDADQYAAKYLT
jgi:deoxyribodipyrimidine photo-lyase